MPRLRHFLTDLVTWLVVLTPIVLLGGGAWLTQHPESQIVDLALDWPPTRPLARWFVDHYRPPAATKSAAAVGSGGSEAQGVVGAAGVEVVIQPPPGWETLPAVIPLAEVRPRVWMPRGTRLQIRPEATAESVAIVDQPAPRVILSRQGEWYRVHFEGHEGWVHLPDYEEAATAALGSGLRPVTAAPSDRPDSDLVALGRELFSGEPRSLELGPYRTWTDWDAPERLARLDELLSQLAAFYEQRFALEPRGHATAAILLYESEADYERFRVQDRRLRGIEITGHVGSGVVALAASGKSLSELGDTIIHEVVHLLNTRAIGPALPPWLSEGLADDLALARRSDSGRILLGTLGGDRDLVAKSRSRHREKQGVRVETVRRYRLSGGLAALEIGRRAAERGTLLPLTQLVRIQEPAFIRSPKIDLHYAESFLFVRFLLDPEVGFGDDFRGYLASIAIGGEATAAALERELGGKLADLDAAFAAWIMAADRGGEEL